MQKSYQYVRICIHVNLLPLFLDIMSYLIMMTSVEEESSFPLPTQNLVQGSFGGEHMLQDLCGGGRTPTRISSNCHMAFFFTPISQHLGYHPHHLREAQTTDRAQSRAASLLSTCLCAFSSN
jgi:hypothetical protein